MQIESSASALIPSITVQQDFNPLSLVTFGLAKFPVDLVKEILRYLTPAETLKSTTLVGRCLDPASLNLLDKNYWKAKCLSFFPQSVECIRDPRTVDWQTFYKDSTILHQQFINGRISQTTKLDHPDFNVKWVKQSGDLVLIASEQIVSVWDFGASQKKMLGDIEISENKIEAIAFQANKIYAAMANLEIWIWDSKNLKAASVLKIPNYSDARLTEFSTDDDDPESIISIESNDRFIICLTSKKRLISIDCSLSPELISSTEHIDTFIGFSGSYMLCYSQTENNERKILKINCKSLKIEAIYPLDHRYIHTPSSVTISDNTLFILTSAKLLQQRESWQSDDLTDTEENLTDLDVSYETVLEAWDLAENRKLFVYRKNYELVPTTLVTFQGTVFVLNDQTILQTFKASTGEEIEWKDGQRSSWPKSKYEDLKDRYDWKLVNGTLIFANSILDLQTNHLILTGKEKCPHNHYHAESNQTIWFPGRLIRVFKCGAITILGFLQEEIKPKLKKAKYSASDCSTGSRKSLDRSRDALSTETLSVGYSTDHSRDSDSESESETLSDIMEEELSV